MNSELDYLRSYVIRHIEDEIKTLSKIKDEVAKDINKNAFYSMIDNKIHDLQLLISRERIIRKSKNDGVSLFFEEFDN